jgi:hypothetical protein
MIETLLMFVDTLPFYVRYQFKLDCWTFFGPVTVAALGAASKEEAQAMHQRINDMYMAAYDHTYPSRQNTTLDPSLEYEEV